MGSRVIVRTRTMGEQRGMIIGASAAGATIAGPAGWYLTVRLDRLRWYGAELALVFHESEILRRA